MSKTVSPEQNTMCRIAQKRNERLSGGAFWRVFDTVFYLVLVVVVTIAIRATLLEPIRVNGTSMTETLQSSDYLFTEKLSYAFSSPKAGDIVICYYPDQYYETKGLDYQTRVKRVVAVAGDTLQTIGGRLYVNGVKVDEPYLMEDRDTTLGINTPLTVPEGKVFVLGDNRINSNDSRNELVGAIPLERIVGKAHFVLFPFSHFHWISTWK